LGFRMIRELVRALATGLVVLAYGALALLVGG
jgi:hypothetical protein